ncbi:MAG: hypothetical protein NTU45_09085 [Planctomycetota bacterium]|nr:hypothetical protein [Planctomycetota bacterium]
MQPAPGTQQNSRTFDATDRRDLELLKTEVARLRRETRSARLLAGLATVGLALGLFAMRNPEIMPLVQTKRLEILDDTGRVALVATTSPQGGRLDLWNTAGANTARLGANELGGDFILWSKDGHAMVSAYAQRSGGRVELGAPEDKVVGVFESAQAGARLSLANRAGNPLVSAGAFEGGGAVRLADADNKDAAILQATANGGSLGLVSPSGVTMARLRAGEAGGEFDLAAKDGPQRVSASVSEKESVVIALSQAGAAKLEAGAAGGSSEILSKNGDRLASLETNEGGGMVVCRAGGDRAVASIGANPTIAKGGLVQLYNEGGNPVFAAAVNAEGAGRLALGTAQGTATLIAESGKDDGGAISLSRNGRRALALLAGSNGGLLNLFSASGVPLVVAGAAEDAAGGAVVVRSNEGKDLVRVGVDEKGSGNVTLFNKDASERKIVAGPR